MTDHSLMKLGKLAARRDPRTLRLARYLAPALPPPPAQVDYTCGVKDWGMMLNDRLGCCTIAAVGHAVQAWRLNAGGSQAPGTQGTEPALAIPDSTILQYYEQWDGYNPAEPCTDQGGVEIQVLNDWRQQGFAGHTLDAYVAIDLGTGRQALGIRSLAPGTPCPAPDIATAIWLFGGAYIGVELPITAQTQDVWDVTNEDDPAAAPGTWGGHAVYLVGYDLPVTTSALGTPTLLNQARSFGAPSPVSGAPAQESFSENPTFQAPVTSTHTPTLTCITWGQPKKMSWAWFVKYCSEAYALVSKDWLNASGISPSGFDLTALENDLTLVTG